MERRQGRQGYNATEATHETTLSSLLTNHICGVLKMSEETIIEDDMGEMADQANSAKQMLDNNSFNAAFDALNNSFHTVRF